MRKAILVFAGLLLAAGLLHAQVPDISILQLKAPASFRAVFRTTKGEFIVEANRSWSPAGVDRLYQLICSGFFSNCLLYRVEPRYVIQFGIASTPWLNRFWDPKMIRDEPLRESNRKGYISFAHMGANSRSTQLFINATDNVKLDTELRAGVKGFTPVARVTKGMDIVSGLYARYGRQPAVVQDSLYKYGNAWFEKKFPGLDRITGAYIIP